MLSRKGLQRGCLCCEVSEPQSARIARRGSARIRAHQARAGKNATARGGGLPEVRLRSQTRPLRDAEAWSARHKHRRLADGAKNKRPRKSVSLCYSPPPAPCAPLGRSARTTGDPASLPYPSRKLTRSAIRETRAYRNGAADPQSRAPRPRSVFLATGGRGSAGHAAPDGPPPRRRNGRKTNFRETRPSARAAADSVPQRTPPAAAATGRSRTRGT